STQHGGVIEGIVTLRVSPGLPWSVAVSHASGVWERVSVAEPSPEGEATRCSRAARHHKRGVTHQLSFGSDVTHRGMLAVPQPEGVTGCAATEVSLARGRPRGVTRAGSAGRQPRAAARREP